MNHRLVYFGLGSLLVAVIALGIAFTPHGEPVELPDPLESVTPLPNDSALRQAVVEVDIAPGYVATISVDGFRLPEAEVTVIEATGVYRWAPTPLGAYLTEWLPGEHSVNVEWNAVGGLADAGSFQWSFRIQ
jgi:hypothetical protein